MKNKAVTATIIQPPTTSINPWTNKAKQRGEGLLNSIIDKYTNNKDDEDEDQGLNNQNKFNNSHKYSKQDQAYLKLSRTIMQSSCSQRKIQKSMREVFKLKQRCDKIDQILEWIQKMQQKYERKVDNRHQQNQARNDKNIQKQIPKLSPIDSNFIYLPVHSINTFNELIQQCQSQKAGHSIPKQIRSIGQFRNMKLKQAVQNIGHLNDFSKMIQNVIL